MNRNRTGESRGLSALALLACLTLSPAIFAQDQDDSSESDAAAAPRKQRIVAEIGGWVAQPSGLAYTPATRLDPASGFGAQAITLPNSTEGETQWRIAYRMPEGRSEVSLAYYAHKTATAGSDVTPGQFNFGERLAFPTYAGYALDGLSDAWEATGDTKLRDARIEYRRQLLTSDDGIELTASIGWRRVWHARRQAAIYRALVPDIPPVLPPLSSPRGDLIPRDDLAAVSSRFEGRGITGGLELRVPLAGPRLMLEASVDLSVLRGKTNAAYSSTTSFFTLDGELLEPPYDAFGELRESPPGSGNFDPAVDGIEQETVVAGLRAASESTTAGVQGFALGFRWQSNDWIDVFGGFRTARYTDVGIDLLPGPLAGQVNNAQDFRRENRSATYEGFYVGIAFHLF